MVEGEVVAGALARRRATLFIALLIGALGAAFALHGHRPPSIEYLAGGYRDDSTRLPLELPFHREGAASLGELEFRIALTSEHPVRFYVIAYDFIDRFEVNGRIVSDLAIPARAWPRGIEVDLTDYVHAGENLLRVTLRSQSRQMGFDMEPSRFDRTLVGPRVLLVVIVASLSIFLWFYFNTNKTERTFNKREMAWLGVIFAVGVGARSLYLLSTPAGWRDHDLLGHVDYFSYLAEHLTVPHQEFCWSCYHPPLYYGLLAAWRQLSGETGFSMLLLAELQITSLILSILTLAIGLAIGIRAFRGERLRPWLLLYGVFLAVFPGGVLASSRINNDALLACLASLVILSSVTWWQTGRGRGFVLSVLWLQLGLLTKNNIIVLYPLVAGLLVFHPRVTWRRKAVFGTLLVVLVGVIHVAIELPRNTERQPFQFRTEARVLSDALAVESNAATLGTFNPAEIIRHPYNDPYGGPRRAYLWEYLFRSAFVGEFHWGPALLPHVAVLQLIGICLVAVALGGVMRAGSRRYRIDALPFAVMLGLALAAIFWLRWQNPYSVGQDFRFISFMGIPIAYFIALHVSMMGPVSRTMLLVISGGFATLCALFFVRLFWLSDALHPANPSLPITALMLP